MPNELEKTEQPHLLVIDAWLPTPDRDAASVRMENLLTLLSEMPRRISFGAADAPKPRPQAVERLEALGINVVGDSEEQVMNFLKDRGKELDLVVISRPHVGERFISAARADAPQAKIVFDTTDLAFVRGFRGAKVTGNRSLLIQALQSKRVEIALTREADCTLVVSQEEVETLKAECPDSRIEVLSLIQEVEAASPLPFDKRHDLLFVGGFSHQPNVDAMKYFVEEVMPCLAEGSAPFGRLHVVGTSPPAWLNELQDDRLVVHGHIPDLNPLLGQCRLSIAPLRFGAGVKGKILLAMAHGLPVVTTTLGTEGIPVQAGTNILVGDDPESFAHAIETGTTDGALWKKLSEGGRAVVKDHFSFEATRNRLQTLFSELNLPG